MVYQIYHNIKKKRFSILFVVSLVSFTLILLKMINIEDFLRIEEDGVISLLYQMLLYISAVYTILFLPSYPFIFILFHKKKFTKIEKLCISIVINISFYILGGFIGYYLGFLIDGFFFIIWVFLPYIACMSYLLIKRKTYFKENNNSQSPLTTLNRINHKQKSSILSSIIRLIFSNKSLLIVFIFLICVTTVIRAEIFLGTDPWYHISVITMISRYKILPINEYFGSMGLHIIGAVLHFFTGLDIIFIPKFFVFYTFPIASLLSYIILKRIFKNQNLAIFGVFMLNFSALGFSYLMTQFSPSSISLIQGLMIFFLLYVRFQNFIKKERPNKKVIYTSLLSNYCLITLLFLSLFLTHSLIAAILLVSYFWIYLIYMLRDFRRGFDIILLSLIATLFFIFYSFNFSSGHFNVFNQIIILPWYIYLGLILALPILIVIILYYRKSLNFTKGDFKLILLGKKFGFYKKFENKIFLPLIFALIIGSTTILIISNYFWFKLEVINIFVGIQVIILTVFAIWGLIIFQNKPRGKPLWLWGYSFALILIAGFIFDTLTRNFIFFSRISYLSSPVIVIGFVAYLYRLIREGSIHKMRYKTLLMFVIAFSLFTTLFEEDINYKNFSVEQRDASLFNWYSVHTTNKNLIIIEYGWDYAFAYYNYPFEGNSPDDLLTTHQVFILINSTLILPSNHFNENNENILYKLRKFYNNSDLYLILSTNYLSITEIAFFGDLSNEDIESYYNLNYFSKIFSSKSSDNQETSVFLLT